MNTSWDKWNNQQSQGRNAPISQVEVEERIVALTSSLENETEAFEALSIDHAKKEAEYKRAWHSEYLRAEGPVKEREAHAGYRTAEQHMESQVAEAVMKAKREKLHTIRTALDSLRTLAANVRAQS
jgi:hypothetical protein